MSYDIMLRIERPGCEPFELDEWNPTFNLGDLFRLAFKCDTGIDVIDGRPAGAVAEVLRMAADRMRDHVEWDRHNPPNGWGTREGAAKVLDTMAVAAAAMREHPFAIFRTQEP